MTWNQIKIKKKDILSDWFYVIGIMQENSRKFDNRISNECN